ncbi:MAG TPA: UxaA family hydrolase [Chloroflexota bacterium]|nr:UxaA family hydrolase [Chloroflexota bacterium]
MSQLYAFAEVARLPAPGDNTAIATRRLDTGDIVIYAGASMTLASTILEGHRFAIGPIAVGESVLSWGLPFGIATRPIAPGSYVCNDKILRTLRERSVTVDLPTEANFRDRLETYRLDQSRFLPGAQVARYADDRFFAGFRRAAGRGVGTRNFIVILGVTSRASSFVRALEERTRTLAAEHPTIDGIVSVIHTEGGGDREPNNLEFLLRTLAGFMVHPNVGAFLAVDEGGEAVTNLRLQRFMEENTYPLAAIPHAFLTLGDGFQANLARGEAMIADWAPLVAAAARTQEPLSELKIALQCGGSDAFSGVSGNPLAAWVAKEVIRYGGAANLAETDELIGSEEYVLRNVRDLATAQQFLGKIERFRERLGWHGATAEGNPSGGNNLRGLYNIAIKSIGAAMKRDPQVRLDYVIDYGERMARPGYYFMDSPGNDLESIAGQVAAGCNLIFFVTGNGSITNFPFVPTIKVVTTTARYHLLEREMDVNAGAYLDGAPMDELGSEMLDLTVSVASGARSVGERAGHSQVSIWRNWQQRDRGNLERLRNAPAPGGVPLPVRAMAADTDVTFDGLERDGGYVADRVGLIMPTSLCAGQIARKIADQLNAHEVGRGRLSRFVALPHTEGCGSAGGANEGIVTRTVLGHLTNPLVAIALLLEHGCEKTHNDYYRHTLQDLGLDPLRFGWASVQADGGIESVTRKSEDWAAAAVANLPEPRHASAGLRYLSLGLSSLGPIADEAAAALAWLAGTLVQAGATVVVPESATFLALPAFRGPLLGEQSLSPTLAYGQAAGIAGFHVMETPTDHWVETLTGLAATGTQLLLAHIGGHPAQGHRMVPLLQVTSDAAASRRYGADLDLILDGAPDLWGPELLRLVVSVASRAYVPKLHAQGNTDFQLTRGPLGVST